MVKKKDMSITELALEKLKAHYEAVKDSNDYGNGRFVRKLLEEAEMNLAERLLKLDEPELTMDMLTTLEESDIPEVKNEVKQQKHTIGFSI